MNDLSQRYVHRTRLLINRGFQLRYIGVFVLSAFVAALVIGGSLYIVLEMSWMVQVEKGLNLLPETSKLLYQSKVVVFGTGVSVFLILSLILSLWGLFLSHRIAGPVYALSRFLTQLVSEKKLDRDLHFRKKDALQEVSQEMNDTLSVLRESYGEDMAIVDQLSEGVLNLEKKYPHITSLHSLYREMEGFKKGKEKWLKNGV